MNHFQEGTTLVMRNHSSEKDGCTEMTTVIRTWQNRPQGQKGSFWWEKGLNRWEEKN